MKLTPIDPAEISARVVFQVTCYVCMNPLFISDLEKLEDVAQTAGRMGWHGCQIGGKSFSAVCPACIEAIQKEVREA